jgi:polyisoprenoid-binding protein YceI
LLGGYLRAIVVVLLAALAAWTSVAAAEAAQRTPAAAVIPLDPAHATLGLEAHALGLFGVPIGVERFAGALKVFPGGCTARFVAQAASLHTADAARQARLLGPGFMDVARYPTFSFAGRCTGGGVVAGALTLHGVTRPFDLQLKRQEGVLVAKGTVQRALWGITSMPVLVGPRIGVTLRAESR